MAAAAGSRLISTPNTRVGIRRRAASSQPYGTIDESTATAQPISSIRGLVEHPATPAAPNGSAMSAAMTSAIASPSAPGTAARRARWPGCTGPRTCRRPAPGAGRRSARHRRRAGRAARRRRGEAHPEHVAPPPGLHERDGERSQELDGDADAEGHGAQREVEHDVHAGHGQPEQQRRQLARPATSATVAVGARRRALHWKNPAAST